MAQKIVATHLVVKAMRDNGYKNAAYALAELMDNSIQAGASEIKLVCIEGQNKNNGRRFLSEIAVIDNGKGMDKDTLELSLGFGNGTHLNTENQQGIGKFGMGLPNSSISQCKKVEVYTWQNNEDVLYSYLDLDEIENGLEEVPVPIEKGIPEKFREYINTKSGTLVLWSKIDRCMWRTAQSIFIHSESLIGRMYRYFIQDGRVSITMIARNKHGLLTLSNDDNDTFRANDPIYLMDKTSCPEPFDEEAMFQKWDGDEYEIEFKIKHDNAYHTVSVKFTYAKEEARDVKKFGNAGDKDHGKHAQKNLGVSIVRAGRELELNTKWTIQYDPRERWWGVEVNFPPSLDDVFGVANNKQSATKFTADLASMDKNLYEDEGKTYTQYLEELEAEEDPRVPLIKIAHKINQIIRLIRTSIHLQTRGERTRHRSSNAEAIATDATKKRIEQGDIGKSDKDEQRLSDTEKQKDIQEGLESAHIDNAEQTSIKLVNDGYKYIIVEGSFDGSAFFSVSPRGGKLMIILNINHPVYPKLIRLLEVQEDKNEGSDTWDALKLVILAWARYEDELPDGEQKNSAQEAREDWGRMAKRFLDNKE